MKEITEEEIVPYLQITKSQLLTSIIFFIITWILALGLWYFKDLDKTILFALNNANFSNTIAIFSKYISRYGMTLIAGVNLILLLYTFKEEKMKPLRPVFLLTILSYGVAGISSDLLKQVFNRPRPIITYAGELNFLTNSHSPAFPSGHATKSVALAVPLSFNNISNNQQTTASKIFVILTAILVCLSRIVLGAHYLSDVLAGAGWSVLCLPVSTFLTNRLLSKMSPERYELASRIWIIVYIALIIFVATI
ncbi:phosphatase PAP2 family protein [Thermoproteota archaeon]